MKPPYEWPQETTWDYRVIDQDYREFEPESFPFTLAKCPACFALVAWSDTDEHKTWHIGKASSSTSPSVTDG